MCGDTVGAGAFANQRAFDGVGIWAPACLAHRRDVIDVDAQVLSRHSRTSDSRLRYELPGDDLHVQGEDRVKKLIMSLAVLAACHSSRPAATPTPGPVMTGNQTGAADPVSAVQGF